jgi:hypothetical protein
MYVSIFVLALALESFGTVVKISNALPRRDTAGQILDAHDGKVLLKDGVYYWSA